MILEFLERRFAELGSGRPEITTRPGNKSRLLESFAKGSGNMDIQDGQDKQHDTLLHGKLIPSMIGCSFEVIHGQGNGLRTPW